ncbi:MAG: hypothetical protein E7Y34_02770, partial [Mycoplasma sp.]|nr:hypothetical protein [Mycoplasma sp.]
MENNKLLNTLQSHLDRNSEIMQIPRDSRYFDLRKEKGSIGASEISSLFPAVCGKDKWINLIKKLVYKEDIEFTRETIRIMKIGQLAETLILDDYCNSNGIYQMTNKNSNNEDMFYYTNPE